MPKQIADVKQKLFRTAKYILKTEGYTALSMRKVAASCSIAVGTVYNYVQNKEELIALVIMEDWTRALADMDRAVEECQSWPDGMCAIYRALMNFIEEYQDIWAQYSQAGGSSSVIATHHLMLREQIAAQITRLMERSGQTDMKSLAPLLAETVLAAAMQPDMDEELVHRFAQQMVGQ